jgi:hypothetical protein
MTLWLCLEMLLCWVGLMLSFDDIAVVVLCAFVMLEGSIQRKRGWDG